MVNNMYNGNKDNSCVKMVTTENSIITCNYKTICTVFEHFLLVLLHYNKVAPLVITQVAPSSLIQVECGCDWVPLCVDITTVTT